MSVSVRVRPRPSAEYIKPLLLYVRGYNYQFCDEQTYN